MAKQVVEAPKIELARKIMESFYNVIDAIKYLRRNLRSQYHEKIRQYFNQIRISMSENVEISTFL